MKTNSTWTWVPSLYFAEGIPYVVVMTLSVIFYKRMGISNADIALYTSWLYLPWVIKPFWGPVVDLLKTKRYWIVIMQLLIGAGFAGVALTIPVNHFFQYSLAFFWLLAFSSATHDIAADGFYMLGLSPHNQAFFVGIRSTFYRLAMLTGQGLLVILAGHFEAGSGLPPAEIKVRTVLEIPDQSREFNPAAFIDREEDSASYFIYPSEIVIGLNNSGKNITDSLIFLAEKWNTENGFCIPDKAFSTGEQEPGWWNKKVSGPLAAGLKKMFGTEQELKESGMNIRLGWAPVRLSRPPAHGETVVMNLSHESGDKSISLLKSYRLEFDELNWDKPAVVVFQADPKLERETSAVFRGLSGNIRMAWIIVFAILAVVFVLFSVYHRIMLPRPFEEDREAGSLKIFFREFFLTFAEFFRKKDILLMIIFLLVYRLGESQLVKMASPFLLDSREMNGLGLTTGEIGLIYGTIGILSLSLGGILGGILASRNGLKYWLWWMVIAMNLPNLVYVYLSYTMPDSLWIIGSSVAVEQFGYGFGFTAYMLYMIYISEGKHKTAHFALTTGFMALGMMIPGMISGWLQEIIGYRNFFIWVMICTIPAFFIIPFIKIDPGFGKKTAGIKNKD